MFFFNLFDDQQQTRQRQRPIATAKQLFSSIEYDIIIIRKKLAYCGVSSLISNLTHRPVLFTFKFRLEN
jgi:hypothetical protein